MTPSNYLTKVKKIEALLISIECLSTCTHFLLSSNNQQMSFLALQKTIEKVAQKTILLKLKTTLWLQLLIL